MKREHWVVVGIYVILAAITAAMMLGIARCYPEPQPAGSTNEAPYFPRLYYPPPGGDVLTVQVNAGPGTWQIKRIARAMDAQVEGVVVRTSGDCAEVDICVNVPTPQLFDEAQMLALSEGTEDNWAGLMTYTDDMRGRTIWLNLSAQRWYQPIVAAHELGHVFGLDHHQSRGVTSTSGRWMKTLHPREIALLNQHYGVTQ